MAARKAVKKATKKVATKTVRKVAAKKTATAGATKTVKEVRASVTKDNPEEFIREIVNDVVFRDGSLEAADQRISDYFSNKSDRQREDAAKRLIPLLSRLVSAAPSLSTMVSARAQ